MVLTRLTCGAVAITAGALIVGACVARVESEGYRTVEKRQFDLPADGGDVTLVTFNGAIEVRSWNRPQAAIEIVKRGGSKELVDAIEIATEQSDDHLSVEARRPPDIGSLFGIDSSGSARLVVTLPERTNLVARSGNGSIAVERLTGSIEMRSEDGRIRGIDLAGDIVAVASDGSIELDSVDGRVELSSGDGRINVEGRLTGLQIETGDGSVRVRADAGSSVDTDWDVWTGDGGIVMTVPSHLDADLDARTANGTVRVQDGILTATESIDRRHVRGRLGDGGHAMRIRTAEGSIRLRAR